MLAFRKLGIPNLIGSTNKFLLQDGLFFGSQDERRWHEPAGADQKKHTGSMVWAGPGTTTLRILFVTDHIHFPQGGGGAERNTHELSVALQDRGFHPAVISSFAPDNSWLSWTNRLRRALPPRREFPRDSMCGYPVFRGWNMDRSGEVVDRFKPDVIVVQSTHPDPLLRALKPHGIPMAVYLHEVGDIDHLASLAGANVSLLANSNFAARRLLEQCGLRCQVVVPLIDPRYYVTQVRPERVLFVNTVPRKGLEIAFAIAERRPDVQFDFVLSWILKPDRVAELAARARKAGNIVLHRPTDDMRSLYAKTRLLLVPSQWEETWGRIVTEAHINGIPVLGSSTGELPQVIGPGGLTVAANAPIEDWLAAFGRLWDNPESYAEFARAAREYSKRDEIQPATIVARLVEILQDTIASSNRAGKADGSPSDRDRQ
jgi:glycosyltransferase involved in cell wall biosynthesis